MSKAAFLTFALRQLNAPYIWGAKGNFIWRPEGLKPLVNHSGGPTKPAFDCSGLVTTAMYAAGMQDWRATHSAQLLHDAAEPYLFEADPSEWDPCDLLFFGKSVTAITHVAIHVAEGVVVEAAGGDSTCTSFETAASRNAKVRIGELVRKDLVAVRTLF